MGRRGSKLGRVATLQRTIQLYRDVAREVTRRGCWVDHETGEVVGQLDPISRADLLGWAGAMRDCGTTGVVTSCPHGHWSQAVAACCQQKPCPRHERRRAERYVARAALVYREHPDWARVEGAQATWKVLTLNLRSTGDLSADVEAAIKHRSAFFRWGKKAAKGRKTGRVLGGWGAIEVAGTLTRPNVHLHLVFYSAGYLVRTEVQRWQRRRTCDLKGCPHPADDRCTACRAARVDCTHPGPGGRERCRGSWAVDIRKARSKVKGKRGGIDGLREALKYSIKPMPTEGKGRGGRSLLNPDPDGAQPPELLSHVELILRTHLALRGRHRVQTYGICRKVRDGEEEGAEDVEPDERSCRCPVCRCPLRVETGWRWDPGRRRLERCAPSEAWTRPPKTGPPGQGRGAA